MNYFNLSIILNWLNPKFLQAIKDGLARVYLFHIPRESGCEPVTDIIKEKCDVTRPSDPDEKVKVSVTGIGANLFKDKFETLLDVEWVLIDSHLLKIVWF